MTKEKNLLYQKAYVELYEIICNLNDEQRKLIPKNFILNLQENMDKNYFFEFDYTKGIMEQDIMVETQALLVNLYIKYLSPKEDDELWNKYEKICLNKIEEIKKEKHNSNDIFKNSSNDLKNSTETIQMIEYKEPKWYQKLFNKILKLLKRN